MTFIIYISEKKELKESPSLIKKKENKRLAPYLQPTLLIHLIFKCYQETIKANFILQQQYIIQQTYNQGLQVLIWSPDLNPQKSIHLLF